MIDWQWVEATYLTWDGIKANYFTLDMLRHLLWWSIGFYAGYSWRSRVVE